MAGFTPQAYRDAILCARLVGVPCGPTGSLAVLPQMTPFGELTKTLSRRTTPHLAARARNRSSQTANRWWAGKSRRSTC